MCFKQCYYKSFKIFLITNINGHSFGAGSREGAVTKCRMINNSWSL